MAAAGVEIPPYPDSIGVAMGLRSVLHPLFRGLAPRVSEYTFANIYLFRDTHSYRLSTVEGRVMVSGSDARQRFFMLPFGPPGPDVLGRMFSDFAFLKNATADEAALLKARGYEVREDRDNFDYVYRTEELAGLKGRKLHAKKNMVNAFLSRYTARTAPLTALNAADALTVLEDWRKRSPDEGDYRAAAEALATIEQLGLTGTVYYVEDTPVAYALGEELSGDTFVLHFEKGVEGVKGLMQYVNRTFAEGLKGSYEFINMEQDLGDEGLRRSKLGYNPEFVKKFKVFAPA